MIVSILQTPRRIYSQREHSSPYWEFPIVHPDGRIKHALFHPIGVCSPHVMCERGDADADGKCVVPAPALHPASARKGISSLEQLYIDEGRQDANGVKGRKNPAKTWAAYVRYQQLLAQDQIPWTTDSRGNPVRVGFPDDCLPDAVLERRRSKSGKVIERGGEDQYIRSLLAEPASSGKAAADALDSRLAAAARLDDAEPEEPEEPETAPEGTSSAAEMVRSVKRAR